MPPRSTRYCRPRKDPPETFLAHLVRRYTYGDAHQWMDFVAQGYAWIERPRPKAGLQAQLGEGNNKTTTSSSSRQVDDSTRLQKDLILHQPDEVLQQGDVICFNPPRSMEPEVDVENIRVLHEDADVVVCVKNGAIPVAEGGRYAQNTLCSVLTERALLEPTTACRTAGADSGDGDPATVSGPLPSPRKRIRDDHAISKGSPPTPLFPVHRLDKETSGIVVMARHARAAAHLADQFHHHVSERTEVLTDSSQPNAASRCEASKQYEAVLEGVLDASWAESVQAEEYGVSVRWTRGDDGGNAAFVVCIQTRIGGVLESPADIPPEQQGLSKLRMRTFPCVPPRGSEGSEGAAAAAATTQSTSLLPLLGKTAHTEVQVLAVDTALRWSLVRVQLFTGRTHQIRVHCAHIGFPVVGDKMYTTLTPGRIGGSSCVDDALYLRRTRGEVDVVYDAVDAGERTDGTLTSSNAVCGHSHFTGALVVKRHLLHACRLSFTHPAADEQRPIADGHQVATPTVTFEESGEAWFVTDVRPCNTGATNGLSNPIHRLYEAARGGVDA